MNLNDDQLEFIKKEYKQLPVNKIARHLKIPIKTTYLAIEGLFGDLPPVFAVMYQEKIEFIYRIISLSTFLILLFVSGIYNQSIYLSINIFALFSLNFVFIFSKIFFFKNITIERAPFDSFFFIFVFYFFCNIFLSEQPSFSITSCLIILIPALIHFCLLHTFKDTTFLALTNFIINGAILTLIISKIIYQTNLIDGYEIIIYLALPLTLFNVIYYQKRTMLLWYFTLLSLGLILSISLLSNLLLAFSLTLFYVTIISIKIKSNSKLFHSKQLYYALIFQGTFIIYCFLFNPFQLTYADNIFENILWINHETLFKNQFALIYTKDTLVNYGYFLFVIICLIGIRTISIMIKIIVEADCFTEKVFAQIPFLLFCHLLFYLVFINSKIQLNYFILLGLILAMTSKLHHYKSKEREPTVKLKKVISISKIPALILISVFTMNLVWFLLIYKEIFQI